MKNSLKKINTAYTLLEAYNGKNPYIKWVQYGVFIKKDRTLSDLDIEYIIKNNDYTPEKFNKVIKIAKWFGETQIKENKWDAGFIPEKVFITDILGETENLFHVYLKYKQNMEKPVMCFIPKKALLDDLRAEDFNNTEVDFTFFDGILGEKNRKLYEHQKSAVKFLLNRKRCLLADDQGLGKALIISTLVYTDTGSKKIGDIKVGDKVIGSDGKPHNVTGVFPQGIKELYNVTFNDGYSIKCCKEHLWTVQSTNGSKRGSGKELDNRRNKYVTLSLEQMLDHNLVLKQKGVGYNENKEYKFSTYYTDKKGNSKWQIPIVKPIEFVNNDKLPIDPYLLGLSLGDGHFSKNGKISFSQHKDDFDELFDNFNIKEINKKNIRKNIRCGYINGYSNELKELGLSDKRSWDKFIPDIYKFSSVEDRILLLQGLMDTDGYCMISEKKGIFSATEYCTVSEQLANDVAELVQCLGGIVRMRTKIGTYTKNGIKHKCRKVYRLNIKMPDGINPFKLKRKSELYNPPKKYKVGRYIKNIEPCGSEEAVCISIDSPDKLYVAEHAIVTHNTTSSIVASIAGGFKKILVICPASLKSNWKKEISQFVPENEIGIINSSNWIPDKKYTIINYDILNMHYVVPIETYTIERVSRDKYGNIKLDKNGNQIIKIIEKKTKSRKKEVKEAAKNASNLYLANFDLVIIDECHKLSDCSSNRYEVIEDFLTRTDIQNVFLMSGTPMTNKPMNLFNVLKLIQCPICDNYEYFVKTYCDGKQITNNYTQKKMWLTGGASNLDELMEKIKTIYLRRLKKDIPGMVTKSIHQRYYELTFDQRLEYDNLWDDYEKSQMDLGNENINKQLTEGIFLRQFVSSAMVENTINLSNEFLEDNKKVFIACCFDEEISRLKEYFGDKAVIYKGGLTIKQKDEAERKFMNDPNTTVFIGNIIAAGVGLTLTSSHICIFNSYDWVPGNNDQMMDRIHRIGQKEDVEVYFQLFSNTISEDMWEKLIVKKLNIESVIKEEKEKVG